MEKQFVPKEIQHQVATWGPYLWQSELLPSIIEEISKRGATVRGFEKQNSSHKLAAIMTDEWTFKDEDRQWVQEALNPWVFTYLKSFTEYSGGKFDPFDWDIRELWVNYQKANDFNPLHNHTGLLSFVLYLDVPEEIPQEYYQWNNRGPKPGSIVFRYGEEKDMLSPMRFYIPKAGDIFIFPSWLEHMGIPFKTPDVERVSVSGNIYVRDK